MESTIEDVMKALLEKAKTAKGSGEAMQFAQAVLNLAHAQSVLTHAQSILNNLKNSG